MHSWDLMSLSKLHLTSIQISFVSKFCRLDTTHVMPSPSVYALRRPKLYSEGRNKGNITGALPSGYRYEIPITGITVNIRWGINSSACRSGITYSCCEYTGSHLTLTFLYIISEVNLSFRKSLSHYVSQMFCVCSCWPLGGSYDGSTGYREASGGPLAHGRVSAAPHGHHP